MANTQSFMPTPSGAYRHWVGDTFAGLPTTAPVQEGDTGYAKDTDALNEFDGSTWNMSKLPYGCFSDSTTQTLATANTAYAITLNTDEYKNQITHSTSVNTSRVTVDRAGVYLITYSACIESPSVNKHINIWLKVDGTTVARTNTIVELPISGEALMTVTYLYAFTAGQYFELFGLADVNNMTIKATAAGATAPASPSIIVTVNQISR